MAKLRPKSNETQPEEGGNSPVPEVAATEEDPTPEAGEPSAAAKAAAECAAEEPAPTEPATTSHPTSVTHKRQWNLLDRVSKGPRAAKYPEITELWKGDNKSKQKALKLYVDANESLQAVESHLEVSKNHVEKVNHKRAYLTIKQMREHGMSQFLAGTGAGFLVVSVLLLDP